jgi:hypothetical protein
VPSHKYKGGERRTDLFSVSTPIEEAWTPPSSWYTDPQIFELERDRIFARNWVYAGRLDQIPNKGQLSHFPFVCLCVLLWI